jgi:hypothetical protein
MVGAKDTQRGRRMRLTRWETSDMGRLEVEIKTGPGPVPADIMLSGVRVLVHTESTLQESKRAPACLAVERLACRLAPAPACGQGLRSGRGLYSWCISIVLHVAHGSVAVAHFAFLRYGAMSICGYLFPTASTTSGSFQ